MRGLRMAFSYLVSTSLEFVERFNYYLDAVDDDDDVMMPASEQSPCVASHPLIDLRPYEQLQNRTKRNIELQTKKTLHFYLNVIPTIVTELS